MTSNVLEGRKAIITGGSKGLGLEIATQFVTAGADVLICGRNVQALESAEKRLANFASSGQKIRAISADVSCPNDADRIVSEAISSLGECHILVNNAGVYGPKGPVESVDWDEWIRAVEINVNGSILMCRGVLPHFKKAGYGKIIQLSGGGATSPLPRLSAYAATKAAVVRFAETLAEEVRGLGIDVNAIAPGALNTGMLDEILQAGPDIVGDAFFKKSLEQKQSGGVPLSSGASLAVFLASSASDGVTAKLISAVWDDWSSWSSHVALLDSSDVFTLRRVTEKDRGIDLSAYEG